MWPSGQPPLPRIVPRPWYLLATGALTPSASPEPPSGREGDGPSPQPLPQAGKGKAEVARVPHAPAQLWGILQETASCSQELASAKSTSKVTGLRVASLSPVLQDPVIPEICCLGTPVPPQGSLKRRPRQETCTRSPLQGPWLLPGLQIFSNLVSHDLELTLVSKAS